ncbi:MAG: hypothetical protein IID63_03445 [candidate division Zixibacteria bacterium]|nr:hypothetical protein [candidate division Zixibacteria bacterium]
MESVVRNCVILELVEQLQFKHSWCGETHIQKATYFLQELTKVETNFDYVLYKHGPFSFDLRDELSSLTANRLVDWHPQSPYGSKCHVTSNGKELKSVLNELINEYDLAIEFVSEHLARENVAELERLGTALYFIKSDSSLNSEALARKVHEIKPHVSYAEAYKAVTRVRELEDEWASSNVSA